MVVFIVLTMMMKRTDTEETGVPRAEQPLQSCAICHEEAPDGDMILRIVGEAGYKRWFCDPCVVDLYEESRLLHDPRSKVS